MKRQLSSIFLVSLYLLSSIGVSGSMHFCGGELASIVMIESDAHPCACGDEGSMEGGCCEDIDFCIKVDKQHKSQKEITTKLNLPVADTPIVHLYGSAARSPQTHVGYLLSICQRKPPDIPLFLLHESFLI